MEKKLLFFFLAVIISFFVACSQPENENDEETYDKNTMKGEWEFTSATGGVTYGNITITNIGTASTATYENTWPQINPWDGLRETFAVIVENDDLKNIIFDIPLYTMIPKNLVILTRFHAAAFSSCFKVTL